MGNQVSCTTIVAPVNGDKDWWTAYVRAQWRTLRSKQLDEFKGELGRPWHDDLLHGFFPGKKRGEPLHVHAKRVSPTCLNTVQGLGASPCAEATAGSCCWTWRTN